jgi:integrase
MPFSADELMAILEAAKTDALMEPIIIAAVCSAMRLGDCCRLRWQDIDEADGFMTVKTSKTRVTIDIPIFPMLYEQLEKHRGRNKTYVFPEQAEQYERNPGLLTTRLRKILWLAGFAGDDSDKGSNTERLIRHEVSPRKARTAVTRKLKNMPESSRKSRMSHALELYLDGNSLKQVASQTQLSQGTVHAYLKEVETETGICIVRGRLHKEKPKVHRGPIRETRTNGKRRASIRDFHSFRTTWITLALTSNLPMEIVRRVTGHTTVDVVLKHYFRPQRAELKKALTQNMPSLLTDGTMVTVHDQALTSLRTADDDNWRTVVDETIALLEGNRSSV